MNWSATPVPGTRSSGRTPRPSTRRPERMPGPGSWPCWPADRRLLRLAAGPDGCPGSALAGGEGDRDRGPRPGRAGDGDRPAERLDPVGETDQAGAAGRVRSPAAVVADQQLQGAVQGLGADLHQRGPGMLGYVSQRLRNDEVSRYLDPFRRPARHADVDPDRHGRA